MTLLEGLVILEGLFVLRPQRLMVVLNRLEKLFERLLVFACFLVSRLQGMEFFPQS